MSHTYIIAEGGRCHGGDLSAALRLVYTARDAGANAIKSQYWSSAQRLADRRHVLDPAGYEIARLPVEWLPILRDAAHSAGLGFLCTVYLQEDIPVVAPYVDTFKIASLEAQDEVFVAAHLGYGKDVLVSTGCQTAETVQTGAVHRGREGARRIKTLHCVSAYPCLDAEANLSALRNHYDYVGFSDHTTSVQSGALAVACGATIIEKHLRLDTTSPDNPDYPHALAPADFTEYVRRIREAEVLLGDGIKRVMPSEESLLPHVVRGEP